MQLKIIENKMRTTSFYSKLNHFWQNTKFYIKSRPCGFYFGVDIGIYLNILISVLGILLKVKISDIGFENVCFNHVNL